MSQRKPANNHHIPMIDGDAPQGSPPQGGHHTVPAAAAKPFTHLMQWADWSTCDGIVDKELKRDCESYKRDTNKGQTHGPHPYNNTTPKLSSHTRRHSSTAPQPHPTQTSQFLQRDPTQPPNHYQHQPHPTQRSQHQYPPHFTQAPPHQHHQPTNHTPPSLAGVSSSHDQFWVTKFEYPCNSLTEQTQKAECEAARKAHNVPFDGVKSNHAPTIRVDHFVDENNTPLPHPFPPGMYHPPPSDGSSVSSDPPSSESSSMQPGWDAEHGWKP